MELIIVIVFAFPIGYFVRDKLTAFVVFIAIYAAAFSFQSMELTREWVGGDNAAFPKNPHTVAWSYGVVNLLIYALGFGLLLLGRRVATKRQRRATAGIDLSA